MISSENEAGNSNQDGDENAWQERVRRWGTDLLKFARTRRGLWTLAGLLVIGVGSCGTGAAVAAWTQACSGNCPTAEEIADFAPKEASQIYNAEGELLGLFYRERRRVVPLDSLPPHVPMAFVAIEDRRFFEHDGIDLVRLAGAVVDNVFNGFGASGASTITMQLPRNLFPQQIPRGATTIRRKIAEMRIALRMEDRLSKEQILELYLNSINLGAGAYGIEAAARTYFDKTAAELSVVEVATLAAIPKAPTHYNPRRNPEQNRARRNLVLDAMAEMGVITEAEAIAAKREPLDLAPPGGALNAPYFVEHVRRELEDRFGDLLYTGGLKIYTTLDPELQRVSEEALEEHLRSIEAGNYGYYRHTTFEEFVEKREAGAADADHTPYLQGVVTVLDPHNGDVLALVGGREFGHSQFNRATQALRQPGSSFKPFVYAAALESGLSPLYTIMDAPISVPQADGTVWTPDNYSHDYEGEMTLREGLKQSKNLVAIRLGMQIGVEPVRDLARRAGVRTPIPSYPSIFIGAAGVYPLDMIAAYAAFSNGGMSVEPRFVKRIEDRDGNLLWEPPHHPVPAMAPGTAWILTDMLRDVVDHGTGYNVRNPAVGNIPYNIPVAGKTGTTNDNTNVWFVGYTPDVLAGVWLGFDQPKTITSGATGGGFAVPVWARVVQTYYENHEIPEPWPRPPDVVTRQISRWTGKPVAFDCPYIVGSRTDFFVASAAPEPGCEAPNIWDDPQPYLPGRPLFPGQPRVPQPGDYIDTIIRRRGGGN
ncbi:MAG TPA: PBP1A family penicillin-binding protein [Longimicrobiaceae bacterium]|nr:PBP1A family penicillin-binding protein [Longimicrobiaceae bacterium]